MRHFVTGVWTVGLQVPFIARRIDFVVYGWQLQPMMTSSSGNIFRVTSLLWGESTSHRWIPLTKASDAELWCFFPICAWTNGWTNNRDAGDLRRHPAHNVTVMCQQKINYVDRETHIWPPVLQNLPKTKKNSRNNYHSVLSKQIVLKIKIPEPIIIPHSANKLY